MYTSIQDPAETVPSGYNRGTAVSVWRRTGKRLVSISILHCHQITYLFRNGYGRKSIWHKSNCGCIGRRTLALVCVAAADRLVVVQLDSERGPMINQRSHEIQNELSIKEVFVLVLWFFMFF